MISALLAAITLSATLTDIGPVNLQFVAGSHWALKDGALAKALRTNTGQKWVLVNVDADQTDLDQWILHEMAHHAAWDEHGEGIAEHGPEFRAACRRMVTRRADYFCKGNT